MLKCNIPLAQNPLNLNENIFWTETNIKVQDFSFDKLTSSLQVIIEQIIINFNKLILLKNCCLQFFKQMLL